MSDYKVPVDSQGFAISQDQYDGLMRSIENYSKLVESLQKQLEEARRYMQHLDGCETYPSEEYPSDSCSCGLSSLQQQRDMEAATLLEQQSARITALERKQHMSDLNYDALEKQNLQQSARLQELEKDARRLDWLDKEGHKYSHGFCHVGCGDYRHYVHQTHGGTQYPSARQTIDAALAADAAGGEHD